MVRTIRICMQKEILLINIGSRSLLPVKLCGVSQSFTVHGSQDDTVSLQRPLWRYGDSARRAVWLPWYGVSGRTRASFKAWTKNIWLVRLRWPGFTTHFFGSTVCEYGTRHLEEVAQNAWLVKRAEDYLFFTPTVDGLASEQARLLTYPLASYWRNGFKQCSSGTVDRQTPGSFNAGGNGQFIDAADRPVTFPTNAHKHTHTHSATCWSCGCCRPSTISQWRFKRGWHA